MLLKRNKVQSHCLIVVCNIVLMSINIVVGIRDTVHI